MRFVVSVFLILTGTFWCIDASAQERGIFSIKATVVKAKETSLELAIINRLDNYPIGQTVTLDVADGAKFEEVDLKVVDGNRKVVRKSIAITDLFPTQPIEVIVIMVGKRPAVLVGVVPGSSASGSDGMRLASKLGGKVRDAGWKDEKRYDINLSGSGVTDEDLAAISTIDDLVRLDLSDTRVTDDGIAHLANHPKLADIVLSGTKVTNKVLTQLATLRSVSTVSVDRTAVTEDKMLKFAASKKLRGFCLQSAGPKGEFRVLQQLRGWRADGSEDIPHVYLTKQFIYYGRYYTEAPTNRKPTTYYHRDGPVGSVLRKYDWFPRTNPDHDPSEARLPAFIMGHLALAAGGVPINAISSIWSEPALAVVELNAGTIAAYGRPFQTIDFYNDAPGLVSLNRTANGKRPPFGFIEDALDRGSNIRIIDGPFKKSVRKEAPRSFYSAIFIDITINQREDPRTLKKDDVHFDLMTQEGIRDLMDMTTPDGVVCFHTSHRSHEFFRPLSAAASALDFTSKRATDRYDYDSGEKTKRDDSHFTSEWVVIARRPEHLARLKGALTQSHIMEWVVPRGVEDAPWRDGVDPEMPIIKP